MSPLLTPAANANELNDFKAYLLQIRTELTKRVIARLLPSEAETSADYILWMGYNKQKFIGMKLK